MNNVKVKTDLNDHLGFFCEKCNNGLIVKKIEPEKYQKENKNTIIHLYCSNCDKKTYIKFYWDSNFIPFNFPSNSF